MTKWDGHSGRRISHVDPELQIREHDASAIASIVSSYFSESTGASDLAIRNNAILGTNHVAKLHQTSVDGTNYYPSRNASIAMFTDISSTYDGIWNEVTGIYPSFQDIEISGNTIQSASGTGSMSPEPETTA